MAERVVALIDAFQRHTLATARRVHRDEARAVAFVRLVS